MHVDVHAMHTCKCVRELLQLRPQCAGVRQRLTCMHEAMRFSTLASRVRRSASARRVSIRRSVWPAAEYDPTASCSRCSTANCSSSTDRAAAACAVPILLIRSRRGGEWGREAMSEAISPRPTPAPGAAAGREQRKELPLIHVVDPEAFKGRSIFMTFASGEPGKDVSTAGQLRQARYMCSIPNYSND